MILANARARIETHNNLVVVVGRSFLSGLAQSIIGVVWQPFVLSLGASMAVLGLLSSLGGMGGLVPTVVSPLGGWFADRRGRKVLLLGGSLSAITAYLLYNLAGFAHIAFALLPGVIFLGLASIAQPANSALVGESVGAEKRGSAYSIVIFSFVVPGILAPLGAGWLADRFGYASVLPFVLGAELVAFFLIARFLRETYTGGDKGTDWRALKRLLRRAWFPPAGLGWFFSAIALDMFAWGMGWGLLYGLLTKTYHFDASQLGILSSITSLTWAVTQLPIGRMIDRLGSKLAMVLSEALGPPLLLIWMTQNRFEIFAASMPLFALTAALWVPARSTYVTHLVAPERRAETFGRLAAFAGLLAFPAPFLGGFLYDQFGFAAPLLGNFVGSAITLLFIILFVKEPARAQT